MGNSSSPQTTTTTSEPPAYLRPYLQEGLQQSRNLYYRTPGAPGLQAAGSPGMYGNGPVGRVLAQMTANWGADPSTVQPEGGGFPEAPVIPFSPQTQTALNMAEQRATAGSPVNRAAQNYATQSLQGGFMGSNPFLQGGTNPYLDAAFNRASGAVTNQVQSNFGLSGRNVRGVDAAGLAQEGYNDLATQIYGGAYESDANRRLSAYQNERGLQQGVIPFAGQLASQDYADIGQLANVGAQYEDLARERAYAPDVALDQYLARLQGFPGSSVTQTTPMERNRLAGALGGAQFGSMFGPWGILGGGILGGLLG